MKKLCGLMTALVTPFREGQVDWPRVESLVDRQIEGGADWLVPCGTTGESPTLTPAERERLIATVVARADQRCPVLAGTGCNDTAETLRRTKRAAALGADAAMIVVPYYNCPSQEGLYRHFAAVADASELPVVIYNVPVRTGVRIENDVLIRLRKTYSHIVAVKDATGDMSGATALLRGCDLVVLCGDDALIRPFLSIGASGAVSVVANLVPSLVKSLLRTATKADHQEALNLHRRVSQLAEGLGRFGPNPTPIKTAMALAGLVAEEFRLPLCPLNEDARAGIANVIRPFEVPRPGRT